jgi:hypothetical protein
MLSLTDRQLQTVLDGAKAIEPGEKRDIFLRRVAMMMKFRPPPIRTWLTSSSWRSAVWPSSQSIRARPCG